MPNRETYRTKALQCLRAAGNVHDASERLTLLTLASKYMTLANYLDGRQHSLTPSGSDHNDSDN